MPHYAFSLQDAWGWVSDEGDRDFIDLTEMLAEADFIAHDLARYFIKTVRPLTAWVDVRNDDGALVARISLLEASTPGSCGSYPH